MALQLGALRDALLDAGATEAKAALAAEELAGYENRFDGLERRLDQVEHKVDGLRGEMNQGFGELRGDMDKRFAAFNGGMNERFAGASGETNTRFAALIGEMNARFAEQGGRLVRMEWMMDTDRARARRARAAVVHPLTMNQGSLTPPARNAISRLPDGRTAAAAATRRRKVRAPWECGAG